MLIIDAIRQAETAQEVCYLLTSYVETLPFYDSASQLPANIMLLPVRGLDDIAVRLASLQSAQRVSRTPSTAVDDVAITDEATLLFHEALHRLQALDNIDAANYSFDRRATARPGPALTL